MKFAFSTLACPDWDFDQLAAKAKEYGYDGVDLWAFFTDAPIVKTNALAADPAVVRECFAAAGVKIACVASAVSMIGAEADTQGFTELQQVINRAAALGCALVRIPDIQVPPRRDHAAMAASFARWLSRVGDYASDRGVGIAIENTRSFRRAHDLWGILEMANHPAVGVCWDVLAAASAGEAPAIAVPTLNSRIRHVTLQDALVGPGQVEIRKLGEGNVQVRDLLRRLMGIGYGGWVSFEWEKALRKDLADPEEALPHAIQILRQWTTPPKPAEAERKPKPKPAPAAPKAAAAVVPAAAVAPVTPAAPAAAT